MQQTLLATLWKIQLKVTFGLFWGNWVETKTITMLQLHFTLHFCIYTAIHFHNQCFEVLPIALPYMLPLVFVRSCLICCCCNGYSYGRLQVVLLQKFTHMNCHKLRATVLEKCQNTKKFSMAKNYFRKNNKKKELLK